MESNPSQEPEERYALVELFGHARIAGRLSDATIGGTSFVRVDVPAVGDCPAYTRLFGGSAIYSISFVSREVADGVAARLRVVPVTVYDLPQIERPSTTRIAPLDDTAPERPW